MLNSTLEFDYERSLKHDVSMTADRFIRVNRYLNRPLASLLVKAVYNTNITPNQLTVLSFFLGVAGAAFFALGEYQYFVWGAILVQLSSIVDCADGMLARARNACSEFGAYLDIFLDRVNEFFIIVGFSVGLYLYRGSLTLLVLSGLTLGLYFLQVTLYYIIRGLVHSKRTGQMDEPRALLMLLVAVFGVANRLEAGVLTLLIVSLGITIALVVLLLKQRKRLDSSG